MKYYKEYSQISLGGSDIASLLVRSNNGTMKLSFGEDGEYNAYLVDEEAEIPPYYHEVFSTIAGTQNLGLSCVWIWIYDDERRVYSSPQCKEIHIYRAGEYGCIIQLIGVKGVNEGEEKKGCQ